MQSPVVAGSRYSRCCPLRTLRTKLGCPATLRGSATIAVTFAPVNRKPLRLNSLRPYTDESAQPNATSIMTTTEKTLLREAMLEAKLGLSAGGIPIGSVLADANGQIISRGHNLRVQIGDPTAHAEVVCLRNAGRRTDWHKLTLVSTLSPCIMCTGASLLYRIPRVIIGENTTFLGAEDLFAARGVQCIVMNDPECIELMQAFIRAHPSLWNEDIGVAS
jgi:cytosine/creatinine deaminase